MGIWKFPCRRTTSTRFAKTIWGSYPFGCPIKFENIGVAKGHALPRLHLRKLLHRRCGALGKGVRELIICEWPGKVGLRKLLRLRESAAFAAVAGAEIIAAGTANMVGIEVGDGACCEAGNDGA